MDLHGRGSFKTEAFGEDNPFAFQVEKHERILQRYAF